MLGDLARMAPKKSVVAVCKVGLMDSNPESPMHHRYSHDTVGTLNLPRPAISVTRLFEPVGPLGTSRHFANSLGIQARLLQDVANDTSSRSSVQAGQGTRMSKAHGRVLVTRPLPGCRRHTRSAVHWRGMQYAARSSDLQGLSGPSRCAEIQSTPPGAPRSKL